MTGRERVLRTLEFRHPDQIPTDIWLLPAAVTDLGDALVWLLNQHSTDMQGVGGPMDMGEDYFRIGEMVDPWGNGWRNLQNGIIGEVKKPALADFSKAQGYQAPTELFLAQWETEKDKISQQIDALHARGKFVNGGAVSLFERMQYLRGTEQLYCDIAMDEGELDTIAHIVLEYQLAYLSRWTRTDVDAIGFGDDWGSQRSLLISPDTWRRIFKPMYRQMIDMCKAAGKKVFFHSDGYIYDLYADFIDLGVDAINSQLWCMDLDRISQSYAGKITFWGEISRQSTLPNGSADDVRACATRMKRLFYRDGGLIGQGEIGRGVPLKNVEALLTAWNEQARG